MLLLLPWPGLGRVFSSAVAVVANPFASMCFTTPAGIHMAPEGPADSWNALVTVTHASGKVQQLLWELRRTPYLPMAVFIAVALGFPLGRRRSRLAIMGAGLIALQALPLMRLLILVGAEGPVQLFQTPDVLHGLLTIAVRALVLPPGMAYAVPTLLWLALLALFDRDALTLAARSLSVPPGTTPTQR